MNKILDFRKLWPHLLVIVGFAILSLGYMSPVLKNRMLGTGDPNQFRAIQTELRNYNLQTGEYTGWTNSQFGGMPTYFIGGDYSKGIFHKTQPYLYNILTLQGSYIFFYLVGMYILLLALGGGLWSSLLGSIGYAFFSYNLQIIEAGHLAKIYALAFAPIMIAGLVLAFRGRPWAGVALFGIGLGLELNANHLQITFYTAILLGIFGIYEFVHALRQKQLSNFVLSAILAVLMGGIVAATNTAMLWTTYDHSKETIRGGSELTAKADTTQKTPAKGLDKEYAFAWSYGKLETLTFLVPNFSGGGSGGELDTKSESYKALTRLGVADDQAAQFVQSLPTYWGDQTFVSGGVYAGAIICFLFVLGLFYADKRYRWPFAVGALVSLMLGWGGNFSILNYPLFDYFPLFNKFRAVSMILSLTQMCMIVVATLGVQKLLENPPSWTDFKKPFLISLGVTAGLALALALAPSLVGLRSSNDSAFVNQLVQSFGNNQAAANDLYNALLDDRASMLRSDALRSLLFILIAAAVVWAFVTQKLKNTALVAGALSVLVLMDMWVVNKRYLNNDDFRPRVNNYDDLFQPSAADQQILQDKSLSYRVLDVTTNPFTNATTSAFHKSLGGYSAAKLRRYQDLIENQLSKNNMSVLNMLNTKYFIASGENGQPQAQINPGALGNAWFVRELKMVNTPDEEMKALDNFNPRTTAIVEKRFADMLKEAKPSADSSGSINLTVYKPNALTYEYNSPTPQIVVFSEIYYKGNEDWKSYVDGQEAPHFRANYLLRAMSLPAGKHTVTFKFDPITIKEGQKIDLWASIAFVAFILGAVWMDRRSKKTT